MSFVRITISVSGSTKAAIDRSRKELGINVSKICEKAINDEIASLTRRKLMMKN